MKTIGDAKGQVSKELNRKLIEWGFKTKRKFAVHYSRKAEKVAKSELPVSSFDPINTLKAQKDFQEIISRKNNVSIEDINILLKGSFWDSTAYGLRATWLIKILNEFKSSIGSRNLPKESQILETIALSFIKYHTVFIEPRIDNLDLQKGEVYLEIKRDNLTKIDAKDVTVRGTESDEIDLEEESMEVMLKNTMDEIMNMAKQKEELPWMILFPNNLELSQKLTLALHLSHLSFQDKIYITEKGFKLVEGKIIEN